jgi:hypothetical protein
MDWRPYNVVVVASVLRLESVARLVVDDVSAVLLPPPLLLLLLKPIPLPAGTRPLSQTPIFPLPTLSEVIGVFRNRPFAC